MKEIVKMARFDYHLARNTAFGGTLLLLAISVLFSLFFSPIASTYMIFNIGVFLVPVTSAETKNGFEKMYGTLPVHRKSIVRGRFLYILISAIIMEVTTIIISALSIALNLNRFLVKKGGLMEAAELTFSFKQMPLYIIGTLIMFVFFSLLFSFNEMLGQIKGRGNDLRNIMIMLVVGIAIGIAYMKLAYDKEILPKISDIQIPESVAESIVPFIAVNIIISVIIMVFGEIAANIVSKREL